MAMKRRLSTAVLAAMLSIICLAAGCTGGNKPSTDDVAVTEKFLKGLSENFLGDADTLICGLSEQEFADAFLQYIIELQGVVYGGAAETKLPNYELGRRNIGVLLAACDSAAAKGYRRMLYASVQCAEKVLYNPRSPYVDEELYLPFAEHVVESKYYPDEVKLAYKEELKLASKNRISTPAADFQFATLTSTGRLYDIQSGYTLIYFNDPECSSCRENSVKLMDSDIIRKLLKEGRLTILSLYTGENLKGLKEHGEGWIEAYDSEGTFQTQNLYAIRAIPSFYLLDSKKRVVLKDAPLERVLKVCQNVVN